VLAINKYIGFVNKHGNYPHKIAPVKFWSPERNRQDENIVTETASSQFSSDAA
jgi:hypothetical protein